MDINLSDIASSESVSFTSRDRKFFNGLMQFMDVETAKLGQAASRERFAIYRLSFEKIIEQSSLYRPLFRMIKQEYEQCINALEAGAEEVQTMSDDLHRLVLQPKTFLLRQKRCMELEDKLTIIEQENRQLERAIEEIKQQMRNDELRAKQREEEKTQQLIKARTGHRRVPGLTFAEETNVKALENYLDFLRAKYARFEENATTKYTSKERRSELQQLFRTKQHELDQEREQRLILRNRLRLYNLTLKTIHDYIEAENNADPLKANNQILLEDAILNALYQSLNIFARSEQNEEDDFDSSALYDREAGVLLNHIELFMDLMDRGNYKEASFIACCSPKGVLRNMETLLKFKEMKKPVHEDMSPWLYHCKILAETALEAPFKPDIVMSLECAKAASSENQMKLLYKWLSENRLTMSKEMAEMAERANEFDLAEFIYRRIGAHYEAASCLLKKGFHIEFNPSNVDRRESFVFLHLDSTKRCIDYLVSISQTISPMKEFLTKLFHEYPSVKFAVDIIRTTSNQYFQADEIVLFFLQLDQHLNAIQFVEKLLEEKGSNCEKHEADKLKTCFDLLKKYSYLANESPSSSAHSNEDETPNPNETEQELAHRLTRRITRSALDRFRRIRRVSNAGTVTLEPIEENPTPQPMTEPEPKETLVHQDFFNYFPEKMYFTDEVDLKADDQSDNDENV